MALVIKTHADRIFLPGAATYTEMISGLWKKIHVTNVLVVVGRQPSVTKLNGLYICNQTCTLYILAIHVHIVVSNNLYYFY